MFLLSFFRAIKFSFQDIFRNFWLSLVTVLILVLSLFIVNLLLAVQVITNSAISSIKDKIDITLYVKNGTPESDVIGLKNQVSGLERVKDVIYVSQIEALNLFRQKNTTNPEVLQSLRELDNNPLTAALVVKPRDVAQYDDLVIDLDRLNSPIVDSKNSDNPKVMLDKINKIAIKVNEVGMIISIIFIIITLLVVYNSVRVNIYTHNREIKVMRLVGASNWFIRAPFIISGLMYTILGLGITMIIFYPFLSLLQPYLETFFSGYTLNIIQYFSKHLLLFSGLEFAGFGMINVLASLVAVQKYSKV
ncbi:MAG: permease-like cell division protein FtsX [bacterium]